MQELTCVYRLYSCTPLKPYSGQTPSKAAQLSPLAVRDGYLRQLDAVHRGSREHHTTQAP